jgi:hypothetical protein
MSLVLINDLIEEWSPEALLLVKLVDLWVVALRFIWLLTCSHQQNISYLLEASRSIWENVECKLRCINFRRVSDTRRAFLLGFVVTGISDNCHSSTITVIAIDLGSPLSARGNFECIGVPLGVPATSQWAPTTSLEASGSTSNNSKQLGRHNIISRNSAGASANHRYYLPLNIY